MKKLVVLFIALIGTFISCDGQTTTPPVPEKTAVEFGMSMGIGWNLGNQLDAHINGVSGETFLGQSTCYSTDF